jgi:hypothetical protein
LVHISDQSSKLWGLTGQGTLEHIRILDYFRVGRYR